MRSFAFFVVISVTGCDSNNLAIQQVDLAPAPQLDQDTPAGSGDGPSVPPTDAGPHPDLPFTPDLGGPAPDLRQPAADLADPPADLSPTADLAPAPADLAEPPADLSPPPCGAYAQLCCGGMTCDSGLACTLGYNSYHCVPPVAPPPGCGHLGESCCAAPNTCSDANTVCSTTKCVTCGLPGKPLCAGTYSCQPGYTKVNGACVVCGASYQACCVNPLTNVISCNQGYSCIIQAGGSICNKIL